MAGRIQLEAGYQEKQVWIGTEHGTGRTSPKIFSAKRVIEMR